QSVPSNRSRDFTSSEQSCPLGLAVVHSHVSIVSLLAQYTFNLSCPNTPQQQITRHPPPRRRLQTSDLVHQEALPTVVPPSRAVPYPPTWLWRRDECVVSTTPQNFRAAELSSRQHPPAAAGDDAPTPT